MRLIIITGPTSTGKTTIARRLAADLDIPTFIRDDHKERRYRLLKKVPNIWQVGKINSASTRELYRTVKRSISQDTDLIIESNLTFTQKQRIKRLLRPNSLVVEVFCFANGRVILKRYIERNKKGERHPGHKDHLWYPLVAIESLGLGKLRYRPLKLSPYLLRIDMNDFSKFDYTSLRKFIENPKGCSNL